jgi:hypothetical protein
MERVKSVPACPRWRWRERAHAAMRSTIGGGAALSLRYLGVCRATGLSTPQGQSLCERTERCGRCAGCGMAFVYRPISRPMHISDLTSLHFSKSATILKLYLSGRRLPCARRAARAARCTGTVLAQLRIRHMGLTWGPSSWAPLLWPRAAHRTTGCPVCHLHFQLPPTSRVSPPIVSRGSARLLARQHRGVARPQPHACSRLVSQVARPLGAMHSRTVTDSGSQHVPSLLRPWNLLSCRSPPYLRLSPLRALVAPCQHDE